MTNNDPRWRVVDSLSDLLAILASIETCRRFIKTQAANADMHNVVLNLKNILREVERMAGEIEKLKNRLAGVQSELIQAIYEPGSESVLVKLKDYGGSADINAAYLVTEGPAGRRFRRVRLPDYVS